MKEAEFDLLLIAIFSISTTSVLYGCAILLSCVPNLPAVWSKTQQEVAHCEGVRRDSPIRQYLVHIFKL